jgi:hypothetical protein
MTDEQVQLAWVIFAKDDRANSRIIVAPSYPQALKRGAVRLRLNERLVDYAPVLEGESVAAAKARVAGGKA